MPSAGNAAMEGGIRPLGLGTAKPHRARAQHQARGQAGRQHGAAVQATCSEPSRFSRNRSPDLEELRCLGTHRSEAKAWWEALEQLN